MKNLLLKTTALSLILPISCPSLKAATHKEMSPSVRISGETSFNMFGLSQSETQENSGKGGGSHFAIEDSRINFIVNGETNQMGGLEYSALIGLSGNPANGDVQENRIKLKGEWGTVLGGNTRGVDDFMAFGAFGVMGGTGGFAGNFTNVLNASTGVIITTDLAGRPKDATKIIYGTPRLNGFQAGVSFTPSTAQKGDKKLATIAPSEAKSLPFDHNQVALALNYREVFMNGIGLKLSVTSLMGQTKPPVTFPSTFMPAYRNTNSYAVGGIISYKDFEFGGEFINNGKSQIALNGFAGASATATAASGGDPAAPAAGTSYPLPGANAGKAGSVAVGYTIGPNKFSLGFYTSTKCLRSDYNRARANIVSVAVDHKFAPGLSFSLEGNFVNMKTDDRAAADQNTYKSNASTLGLSKHEIADGVTSNSAQVFIFNTKLKF